MPTSASTPFNCPNCKASYKLVRVKAPPVINENQLTCLSCGGPLTAREGGFVLKYFFYREIWKAPRPVIPATSLGQHGMARGGSAGALRTSTGACGNDQDFACQIGDERGQHVACAHAVWPTLLLPLECERCGATDPLQFQPQSFQCAHVRRAL